VNDARKGLLIVARKFTRKLILVTTDWRLYEGTARVFRPHPWEEMAAGKLSKCRDYQRGGVTLFFLASA
jgi:hypothetical protein